MSRLGINTGNNANDSQGDTLRSAMGKINANFSELYEFFGDGFNLESYANSSGISSISEGLTGDPSIEVSGIVNSGITTTEYIEVRNITSTGIITAVQYFGDGSQLENVIATNSGVEALDNDVRKGVAQELNFRNGITVSAPDGVGRVDIDVTAISEIGDNVITGVLTATDRITVGAATTFTDELVINGNARITGILTIGTGSITLDANARTIEGVDQIKVGQGSSTLVISQNLETGSLQVTDELSGDIKGEVGFGSTSSINTTGIVTASAFYGDGSNLTGIDATALKDSGDNVKIQANTSGVVVTGVLTATSFEGDGSTLENIVPNIAIASSTTADIEILFEDDYGDGWNGGEVDVYVNDVLVSDNFTIPDDGEGDALSFLSLILNDVSVGSTIKIERVTEGDYPEEMVVNTIRVYGDTTGSLNGLFGTQRYFFGETGIGTTTVTLNVANFQIPPSPTGTLNEVRYNVGTQSFELYNGTAWVKTGAGLKIQKDTNLISDLTTFPDNGAEANNNDNIFLGRNAGCGIATFSSRNIFMGPGAGQSSGNFTCNNNFFGECAGYQASGRHNNFFGECAGFENTTNHNNFFGQWAGLRNTTGFYNNFLGYWSGCSNTTGGWNFFVGQLPGSRNTTGSNNTFIGNRAGCSNTTGDGNIYIGRCAGRVLRGNNNIGLGCEALSGIQAFNDPDANDNIGLGFQAGKQIDTGSCNIFIGSCAGWNARCGTNNVFLGQCAGVGGADFSAGHNTVIGKTAAACLTSGTNNNIFGQSSGNRITTGSHNNFFGQQSGFFNSTGNSNNFMGYFAGECTTSGGCNNFFGQFAGKRNTTGSHNNFFGLNAGYANTDGKFNNFFGFSAGYNNITGCCNNFIGFAAGCNQTAGDNNIVLGSNVQLPNLTGSDQLAIGSGSNHWLVGDENFNVGIGTTNPKVRLQIDGVLGFGTFKDSPFTPSRSNIRIGDETTGANLTTGYDNIFIGGGGVGGAGNKTTTGYRNIFLGPDAGSDNTDGASNVFIGYNAGSGNTTGFGNLFVGSGAGYANTTGEYNTFFGGYAGYFHYEGDNNNFFGALAGYESNGSYNNFFGRNAGRANQGDYNNFFGGYAGWRNTFGNYNNSFGTGSGSRNTTGTYNNFFGYYSGSSNTTGSNNIFFGSNTGASTTASNKIIFGRGFNFNNLFDAPDTTKDTQFAVGIRTDANPSKYWLVGDENFNIGIGTTNPTTKLQVGGVLGFGTFFNGFYNSTNIRIGDNTTGANLTSGYDNIFMGVGAGNSTTSGCYNNFFGPYAGYCNTTGSNNNFLGGFVGYDNTTGSDNNFFGNVAGVLNTTGNKNNFIGAFAGRFNTTGSRNNFFGFNAGYCNTTGCNNNFFGYFAGRSNTTASGNNFLGNSAGEKNTTGCHNNFFGPFAGYCNTDGYNNNFFGQCAGFCNTTGFGNNFFGRFTGFNNTTGNNNIIIGEYAGCSNTTGNHNIFLGSFTGRTSAASNKIILGRGLNTSFRFDSPNTTSDAQLAIGIRTSTDASKYWVVGDENFNIGIGTINPTSKLTVTGDVFVSGIITSTDYNSASDINLKTDISTISNPIEKLSQLNGVNFIWKASNKKSLGVIAQEVEEVLPELVSGENPKTVNYNGLIGLLIECVKEQQKEIDYLKSRLDK